MTTAARTRLPNRRETTTLSVEHGGRTYAVSVSLDRSTGRPLEVFIVGAKGEEAALLDDAAVVISIALQHGLTPEQLGRSTGRVPTPGDALGPATAPASAIGKVLDLLRDGERLTGIQGGENA